MSFSTHLRPPPSRLHAQHSAAAPSSVRSSADAAPAAPSCRLHDYAHSSPRPRLLPQPRRGCASARSTPRPRLLPHPCRRPASTRSRPLGTRLRLLPAADTPPPAPTPAACLRHDRAPLAPHRPRVTERRRRASGLGWSARFGRTIPTRI